jgi:hypothetical protein
MFKKFKNLYKISNSNKPFTHSTRHNKSNKLVVRKRRAVMRKNQLTFKDNNKLLNHKETFGVLVDNNSQILTPNQFNNQLRNLS